MPFLTIDRGYGFGRGLSAGEAMQLQTQAALQQQENTYSAMPLAQRASTTVQASETLTANELQPATSGSVPGPGAAQRDAETVSESTREANSDYVDNTGGGGDPFPDDVPSTGGGGAPSTPWSTTPSAGAFCWPCIFAAAAGVGLGAFVARRL